MLGLGFRSIPSDGTGSWRLCCLASRRGALPPAFSCIPPAVLGAREFTRRLTPASLRMTATQKPSTHVDLDECMRVALEAATAAGSIIREAWDKPRQVHLKTSVDLVTETDKQCEEEIYSRLRAAFPDHAFIGEEGSASQGFTAELTDAPTWLVDPVDGTTNFVHRYPFTCVSIGLAVGGAPVLGVVANPILGEVYRAMRGGGAFLNNEPIHVSATPDLQSALFATELGIRRDDAFLDAAFARIRELLRGARSVRCGGSCALNLCSVAQGRRGRRGSAVAWLCVGGGGWRAGPYRFGVALVVCIDPP
ncbi:hypothetical protein ACKKBG_A29640 [Auxenochlorella protothecoides x Auxenochlorella symbiontica]